MSEVWSKWTRHVVNGTFPLRRYLGASDHSGVFLTEFAGREPHEVAIKLVRAIPILVDSHGAQWEAAADLANPHLVQLLEAGQCQLDGLPYLYLVMEYAEQTLAQLLEHRAMAEDEAREMLLPILDTLAFLHNRNMVQGQLKPANILVIGDTLKLASDTIRSISDATASINMVSVYDPPEVHDGSVTTAGDMWALGITLFEALTRSPPMGMDVRREGIILPPDFSPMFRDIVASCLSRRPYDRPKAAELAARMRGQSLESEAGASGAAAAGRTRNESDAVQSVLSDSFNLGDADRVALCLPPDADTAGAWGSSAVSEVESGSQPAGRASGVAADFTSRAALPPVSDTGDGASAAGAESSTREADASSRPTSPVSRAVNVLDKLVSILGPGSRASAAASQAATVAAEAGAGTETRPALDAPGAARTVGQRTPVAPVGDSARAMDQSGSIAGPGSGPYGAAMSRGGPGAVADGSAAGRAAGAVADGSAAGRAAGVTPAGIAGTTNRPGGIAGPSSATVLGSPSRAAAGVRGASALGSSGPSALGVGLASSPDVSSPAAPGATAPGTSRLGATGPGATAPRVAAPMPGSTGASAGTGRSAMSPLLDASGRYRAVPPSAGSPASAGGAGENASLGATDASGRYRAVPGAGAPGGMPGATDASGRYRTVSTPSQQGGTPNRASPVVSSGMTSAPGATSSAPARSAPSSTLPGGGVPNRSASVSASVSTATAAAARAAAAAVESHAASRIASATGAASSRASRTASSPMANHGAVSRPAAPGARAPGAGAHDAGVVSRPPFAGTLAQPVSPVAAPDPTKAQRPTPRPIVIEHFTPESLLPPDTGRRPGTNTSQPSAAPSGGPKESNFVGSNTAAGYGGSSELTPSDVAAALESGSVSDQEPSVPRLLLPLAIGAVLVLALALIGVYVLRTHANSTPAAVEAYQDVPLPTQADATPPVTAADEPSPAVAASDTSRPGDTATPVSPPGRSIASTTAVTQTAAAAPAGNASPSAAASSSGAMSFSRAAASADSAPPSEIHEEIPAIPPRIRERIRGHVRVAVRLIVDKEGSVFAALVDEPGPSRYFEKLAIEAAKKWTFPPMDTTGSRLELVRFDFTRQGASGRAVEIE